MRSERIPARAPVGDPGGGFVVSLIDAGSETVPALKYIGQSARPPHSYQRSRANSHEVIIMDEMDIYHDMEDVRLYRWEEKHGHDLFERVLQWLEEAVRRKPGILMGEAMTAPDGEAWGRFLMRDAFECLCFDRGAIEHRGVTRTAYGYSGYPAEDARLYWRPRR